MSEAKVWIWSPISLGQAAADSSYLQPLSAMKTGCSCWLGKAGLLSLSAAAAWGSRTQVWEDAAGGPGWVLSCLVCRVAAGKSLCPASTLAWTPLPTEGDFSVSEPACVFPRCLMSE